jgi:serine/threonine protein kinase
MQTGDMLGRYRLIQSIGRGGMGEVWLASASGVAGFEKKVVVKTILPERAADPSFIDLLTREARVCGELNHPNLIEVFDFSEHAGVYALAMEYIAGRSLSQMIRAARAHGRRIMPWCALRVIWESCRGIEYAHEHNIVHCDLSPGNIMVSFAGFTKVLDFGVAHHMGPASRRLKGKYHYMAPERVRDHVSDRRTDVYALGVILYVLFTGRVPISAPTDEALMIAIVERLPKPPSAYGPIDPEIEQVIMRALDHDPARRFQNVGALMRAISHCHDGQPGACSQLDVGLYLGTLFPDDPDLPEHIKESLAADPNALVGEHTQRAISLGAVGLPDDVLEIAIDPSDDGPAQARRTPTRFDRPRAGSESDADLKALRRLFETTSPRSSHSNVFDAASISGISGVAESSVRGVFAESLAAGSTTEPPAPEALEGPGGALPGMLAQPSLGESDRHIEAWPWPTSLKPQS